METISSRVTSKGQVVIPKKFRKKYGISECSAVRWIEQDHGILLVPESRDAIFEARGILEGAGVLQAYLKEKKREKHRENKQGGR